MPLTGGDINKIPPGPGGSARLPAGACRHLHDHRRGTTARPGRPFLPHGICRILTRGKTMPPTTSVAATPAGLAPPRPAPGVPSGSAGAASGRDRRPAHRLQTIIIETPCDLASDLGTAKPQRAPAGQDWQEVTLPLRLLLGRGPWLAIATVVGARSRRAAARHRASGHRGRADHRIQPCRAAGPGDPGPGRPATGQAARGSGRRSPATPACAARSAWTFYAADSPSWPRDNQPQARQERQSPGPLPPSQSLLLPPISILLPTPPPPLPPP